MQITFEKKFPSARKYARASSLEPLGVTSREQQFANPTRRTFRRADSIPLSTIAAHGQISHKITGDEDSGPSELPRGNIFSVRARFARAAQPPRPRR